MKKIFIIYNKFYDYVKADISIGGIQTYIKNLCNVIKSMGNMPVVYQTSSADFVCEYNGIEIHGLKTNSNSFSKLALKKIGSGETVIFATEGLIRKYKGNSIAIQHGIAWDKPSHIGSGNIIKTLLMFKKFLTARKKIKNFGKVSHVVCVDYNFINWYRALTAYQDVNLIAIPNFSEIPEHTDKPKNELNIIFARRLFEYRGTRIFAEAIERLLSENYSFNVTIAGDGPDELWLKEKFKNRENVSLIKYNSSESIKIHLNQHIAVVPTIGSEGTSLSLLEAMAAGCAVVCSNVGGMTNIVLDRYNGLMINATSEQIYSSLKMLIDNSELREYISKNAYKTVKASFSFDLWKSRWIEVINEIL